MQVGFWWCRRLAGFVSLCWRYKEPPAGRLRHKATRRESASLSRLFLGIHLPQHLPQDAEPDHGVARRQIKAADKPPDSLDGVRHAAAAQESAGAQRFEQHRGNALEFSRSGELELLRRPLVFGIANQFIQANRDRLPQVHRDILIARGDAHEPVTMAEGLVRKPKFLRTKEERHTP